MYQITDDSGFLAIFDPEAYSSFVAEDWTLKQLLSHLQSEMNARHLLIWGTGLEGIWRVDVRMKSSKTKGVREVTGSIEVSKKRLALINYESLTMGAQFSSVHLPERHMADLVFPMPRGLFTCRVIQLFDPEVAEAAKGKADFVIELTQAEKPAKAWGEVPWFKL